MKDNLGIVVTCVLAAVAVLAAILLTGIRR
jgi:hypothetical protein